MNITAVEAHPDDIEFMCAGTLARLSHLGHAVSILSVTGGEYGSATLVPEQVRQLRVREAQDAAAVINATFYCANGWDKHFIFNEPVRNRVIEILRISRPDIVFAPSPKDYVLDHDFASLLARDAATAASVGTLNTGELAPAPPLPRIPYLYYCEPMWQMDIFGNPVPSSTYVDVTEALETKKHMLACHVSQAAYMHERLGHIAFMRGRAGESDLDLPEIIESFGRNTGQAAGFAYAEGFRQHLAPPFPSDNILVELLGEQHVKTQRRTTTQAS